MKNKKRWLAGMLAAAMIVSSMSNMSLHVHAEEGTELPAEEVVCDDTHDKGYKEMDGMHVLWCNTENKPTGESHEPNTLVGKCDLCVNTEPEPTPEPINPIDDLDGEDDCGDVTTPPENTCSHENAQWEYGETHVLWCNDCSTELDSHAAQMSDFIELDDGEHGKRCNVDGCSVAYYDHLDGCYIGTCPICVDETIHDNADTFDWTIKEDGLRYHTKMYYCCEQEVPGSRHLETLGDPIVNPHNPTEHGYICTVEGCGRYKAGHEAGSDNSCELCAKYNEDNNVCKHDGELRYELDSDGLHNEICVACDKLVGTHEANFEKTWKEVGDGLLHAYVCEDCDMYDIATAHSPNTMDGCFLCTGHVCSPETLEEKMATPSKCNVQGVKQHYECTAIGCGKLFVGVNKDNVVEVTMDELLEPFAEHSDNYTIVYDDDEHWTNCSVCGTRLNVKEHEMLDDAWEIVSYSTCTKQGEQERMCEGCEYKQFKLLPFAEHGYVDQIDEKALKEAPNCDHGSIYYYSCSNCGLLDKTQTFEDISDQRAHDYKDEYQFDETHHYHECVYDDCDYKTNINEHGDFEYLIDETNGTHQMVCGWDNCGYKTEPEKHTFNQENVELPGAIIEYGDCQTPTIAYKSCVCGLLSDSLTFETDEYAEHALVDDYDDDSHFVKCIIDGCDFIADREEHVFDREVEDYDYLATEPTCGDFATYYKTCKCGAMSDETFVGKEKADHFINEDCLVFNENGHYHECQNPNCDYITLIIPHVFDQEWAMEETIAEKGDCETPTKYFKSCECGAMSKVDTFEVDAPGHNWSTSWKSNEENHWIECRNADCAETKDADKHTFGDDDICDVCNYAKHEHEYVAVPGTPSTCLEDGILAHYTCTKCDLLFADGTDGKVIVTENEIVDLADGHIYHYIVEKPATETENGFMAGTCKCGDRSEVVLAVNSTNVVVNKDNEHNGALADTDILDKIVISQKEAELLADGIKLEISLNVKDAKNTATEEEKALIEKEIDGKYNAGLYLDITLTKQFAEGNNIFVEGVITETEEPIEIKITLPEELTKVESGKTRIYKVVRIHDGVTTILDAEFDAATKTLTFKTDAFSMYSVVYADEATSGSGTATPEPEKPANPDDKDDADKNASKDENKDTSDKKEDSSSSKDNKDEKDDNKKEESKEDKKESSNTSSTTTTTDTTMPDAGDESNLWLNVVIMVVSFSLLVTFYIVKRKEDE